jgi:FixJ family two-component response regulator
VFEGLYDSEGFPPMILITAFGDARTHFLAKKLGAAAMFDKPFEVADLIAKANEIVAPLKRTHNYEPEN